MKKFTILLVIFALSSNIFQLKAQEKDSLTPSDKKYTGVITKEDFEEGYTKSWFVKAYKNYKPNEEILNQLKEPIQHYTIKAFMGTWCPDSRRETPKLFKLLDLAEFNRDNLTVYAMDRKKSTEENYEKDLNVHHVPTIIFFNKDGKEVNRFVEFPQETFEEDILKIVSEEEYKNPYEE